MNLFGLDPTAQAMALVSAGLVLLGAVVVCVFVLSFRHQRDAARDEVARLRQEVVELRRANTTLRRLRSAGQRASHDDLTAVMDVVQLPYHNGWGAKC